ncbi:MAG TPA: IclR family transcriptional regulator [Candidatus Limnocylindrales bacterium]|nr:IclR family transcriptional regulator [Candidatus Limnocylindrales bacterium]
MSTSFGVRNKKVQSLDRALEILDLLAAGREMGVTDLARRLEVHKSTAFRLLATLEARGLVEQNPLTEKYRLGYGLVRLAGAVVAEFDLSRSARAILEDLAERTNETVNLAVLQGDQVVNIDQITAAHLVVNVNWVGKQTPLHCTSNGKVLLAHADAAQRDRILAGPLRRFTPRTITDRHTLERQLKRVLEDGYAFTLEELEVGLNAVAAPVKGAEGRVVGAVSIAGPAYRVSPQRLQELGEMAKEAGEAISQRLGYSAAAEVRAGGGQG